MSFKVGEIFNGARIDNFEPGTILKELPLDNPKWAEDDVGEELWIISDDHFAIGLKNGFTWTDKDHISNFEILKLPG